MIDFFSYAHVLPIQLRFAFFDAGNNKPIQIQKVGTSKKEVVVISNYRLDYNYIPVDHNIPLKKNGTPDRICDVIVFSSSTMCFVEIKNWKKRKWLQEALPQIINTINHYKINHSYSKMGKIAYVCNCRKKESIVCESHIQVQNEFFEKYKIRLYISPTIKEFK